MVSCKQLNSHSIQSIEKLFLMTKNLMFRCIQYLACNPCTKLFPPPLNKMEYSKNVWPPGSDIIWNLSTAWQENK